MENKFNQNDFEQFLKENADQYRMFPSEKVWKGIHNTLHTRRRWYGIGLSLLILTTAVVSWVMLSTSGKNRVVVSSLPPLTAQQSVTEIKEPARIVIAPVTANNYDKLAFVTSQQKLQHDQILSEGSVVTEPGTITQRSTNAIATHAVSTLGDPSLLSFAESVPSFKSEPQPLTEQLAFKTQTLPKQNVEDKNVAIASLPVQTNENNTVTPVIKLDKEPISMDLLNRNKVGDYPMTIESVVNSYQHMRKRSRISYRELSENKPFIAWSRSQTNANAVNATYTADINNVVTHKPDLGLQLGFSAGLPLSKKLKLIGGLQFNVSKYDIQAYDHPTELTTIALSTAAGGGRTMSAYSYYRNAGGSKANWLQNFYFSASAPIGLEMRIAGTRRNYFGVSATAQPTYILDNKSYLLSTDYKNYAKVPALSRKWNMNAGFEMFAGVSTGSLKWRVGPQVRYQVMSSYIDRYPIREHLFDFGLKMGIMLNK